MITNPTHLENAFKQLSSFQDMLEAMRRHCYETQSPLFPIVSEGYLRRITELQTEIMEYLRERPADAPLRVRVQGPGVKHGIIKATFVSRLLAALQSAMYHIGGLISQKTDEDILSSSESLRSILSLDMVATAPGSFILVMDIPPRQQQSVFGYNIAEATVEQIIKYIQEIYQESTLYSGDQITLQTLSKVANLVGEGIETIDISYALNNSILEAHMTPTVRDRIDYLLSIRVAEVRTVTGVLIEIDTEQDSCKIKLDDQTIARCRFDEELEDRLLAVMKCRLEISGRFTTTNTGRPLIEKIEDFRLLTSENAINALL